MLKKSSFSQQVTIFLFVLILSQCVMSTTAQAETITKSYIGTITSAVPKNPLGVKKGQKFNWMIAYEASYITDNGESCISGPNVDPSVDLIISIGNQTLHRSQAWGYPDYPVLCFNDGKLYGIDFIVDDISYPGFSTIMFVIDKTTDEFFIIELEEDTINTLVEGSFDYPGTYPSATKSNSTIQSSLAMQETTMFFEGESAVYLPDYTEYSYWAKVNSGTVADLNDVWASGPDDVWVVGDNATILHYDGITWNQVTCTECPNNENLFSVWGRSANEIYITGSNGLQIKYHNGIWNGMGSPDRPWGENITGIWGSSSFMYSCTFGGTLQKTTETLGTPANWSDLVDPETYADKNVHLNDVYVDNYGTFYAGGYFTDIPYTDTFPIIYFGSNGSLGGSRTTQSFGGIFRSIQGIWGTGNDLFMVGDWFPNSPGVNVKGRFGVHDITSGIDASWLFFPVPSYTSGEAYIKTLFDVWGMGRTNFFVSGTEGKILHLDTSNNPYDYQIAITETTNTINGLFGTDESNIWAVGSNGTILHYGDLPTVPAPNFPQAGTAAGGTSIYFEWVPSDYASDYYIQIAYDQEFTSMFVEGEFDESSDYFEKGGPYYLSPFGVTLNAPIIPWPNDGTRFYWRVKGINSAGESDYSETRYFFNIELNTDFDSDGDTDGADLAVIGSEFNRTDCTAEIPCQSDLDGDGDVDDYDLELFLINFGN